MKPEKTNQILLGACVLLLGLNGITALSGETTTEIREPDIITVTDLSVAQLGSLSLKHENLTLGILMIGDQFEFITDAEHDFGISEIRSLVYSLCNMQGVQEFSDKSLWGDFGYDTPQSSLILTAFSGEKWEFSLLKTLEDHCYLYDHQRDTVFLVDALVGRLLLAESEDFYQKTIFPVIDGTNYPVLDAISVEFPQGGRDYILTQEQGRFYLKEPISHRIPVVYALSQLVTQLSALYGDEVVEIGADLADYLVEERCDLKVTMEIQGEKITVFFLPETEQSYWMAVEETGDIFRMYGDYTAISQDYLNLLQGKVLQFAMGDVAKLVLTQGADAFVLEMAEDGSPMVGGEPLEQEAYQNFVTALNALELQGEVEGNPTFDGEVALDLYYHGGEHEKILFSAAEEGLVLVSVDGSCFLQTSEAALEKLLKNIPN